MPKALLSAVVLLAAASAQAQSERFIDESGDAEAYCSAWANNGMTGAVQGLRGKSLKFIYEPMRSIMERVRYGLTDVDGMVFPDRNYAPEQRPFFEESVAEGWRWAQDHLDRSKPLPGYGETREEFYTACMRRRHA